VGDRNTVYDYAGRGEIPHCRLGKRLLFSRNALVAWLGSCKAASARKRVTMPIRRGSDGRWRYREVVRKPDGTRERVSGCAPRHINTMVAAQEELRQHIERILHPERATKNQEVMTFKEWFNGRFWREWVVGRKNRPTEVRSKQIIYRCHLEKRFEDMPLDEITVSEVAQLRADLIEEGLSEKRINSILAVLSKPLKYAVDCELIARRRRSDVQGRTSRGRRVGLRPVCASPRGGQARGRGLIRRRVSRR